MSTFSRLTQVFKSSKEIYIDKSSKLILMSDVHRGNNSQSDNFAPNKDIFITALNHYLDSGFTYIEIGDGDELWENRNFSEIRQTHSDVFELLQKFYNKNRLYLVFGNHDVVKKRKNYIKKNFKPLFEHIEYHEGLILRYLNDKKIFIVHGHQGDLLNDKLWMITRFLCRYVWRHLERYLDFKDLTSAAKNYKKKEIIEEKIINWAKNNNQMIIAGHTHRPMFPTVESSLYFNTGSCIYPGCITGIEIENGKITLVKWCFKTNNNGVLHIVKENISGSKKL